MQNKKSYKTIGCLVAAFVFYLIIFILQRIIFFAEDDNWYITNLVTGNKIANLSDIIESQVWHYFNWGGRSINHGVLQMTLALGELAADILNTLMCVIISFLICKLAGVKEHAFRLLAIIILIALNPAFYGNMFWQSGAANYLYATTWIFCFVLLYLAALNGKTISNKSGIVIWMPILGLITGWSCENMGPASFLLAVGITFYLWKWEKKRPTVWMIEGIIASLAGSAFMILAPGNYVRSGLFEYTYPLQRVVIRVESMLTATFDYLFPMLILTLGTTLVYLLAFKKKFTKAQFALLAYGIVAHGGMSLSPTYPSRAVFGVLSILTAYIISLFGEMISDEKVRKVITILGILMYVVGLCRMVALFVIPPFTR